MVGLLQFVLLPIIFDWWLVLASLLFEALHLPRSVTRDWIFKIGWIVNLLVLVAVFVVVGARLGGWLGRRTGSRTG